MGDKREEPIVPHNHSTLGAAATRAGGTAGGAVKGGISTVAWTIGGLAIAGAVVGLLWVTGALPVITGAIGAMMGTGGGASGLGTLFNILGVTALGGAIGAVIGAIASPVTGFFGTVKGGFDGYEKADTRISQERGAAQVMNAELQALQSQAMIMQASQAQARVGDRYANASTMLQADHSALQAAQLDGRMTGLQLQTGR